MSVVNRERRQNAGKRMAIMGKKLEEEDDAFWGHETWADDVDSGNESFHESDEDSALKKDIFDSDFNDSESDNEDDELAAGEAAERELRKSERTKRRQNSNNNAYKNEGADFHTLGGHKRRRGVSGGSKRAIGEGFNSGIVLNMPPESFNSLLYSASISAKLNALQQLTQAQRSISLHSTTDTVTDTKTTSTTNENNFSKQKVQSSMSLPPTTTHSATKPKKTPASAGKPTRSSRVLLRELRSTDRARKLRETFRAPSRRGNLSLSHTSSARKASSGDSSDTVSRLSAAAAKQKRYAQEELLLEAVHQTEPENQRWLHGRKRVQDQYNRDKDSNGCGLRDKYRGKKIIHKFHSRRGCLITLTFPEMDSVPEILTRRQQSIKHQHQQVLNKQQESSQLKPLTPSSSSKEISQPQQQQMSRCVITGKIGKYKDPLTNYSYHDLAAFKVLRRKHKNGVEIANKSVVASSNKCNVDGEGSNRRKPPHTLTRNNPVLNNKLSKRDKCKRFTNIVDSSDNYKKTVTVNREEFKKSSSSAINVHHMLPFQSPKPPSKSITNRSLPKTSVWSKAHPFNGNMIAINQHQLSSVQNLALSWEIKPNSSTTAKTTNSPVSPGDRRLSPRKWNPSENILETIAILPEIDNGDIAVIPRGLRKQPPLTSSSSNNQRHNNGNNKSTIGYTPVDTDPSSYLASKTLLTPNPPPPDKSHTPSMEGVNQTAQNYLSMESVANGGHDVATSTLLSDNSMENSYHHKIKGSNETSEFKGKRQQLVNIKTPMAESSSTVAIGHSRGDVVTDSSHVHLLSTSGPAAGAVPFTDVSQHLNSSSDVIVAKLEDSVTGDKRTNINTKG